MKHPVPGRIVLWLDGPHDAPENMARDAALLERCAGGAADVVFRLFTFSPPGITLGRAQDPALEAAYLGGYHAEGGLIQRQMREQGLNAQLIMGDSVNTLDFWAITGDTGEGMIFTFAPDPQKFESAKAAVDKMKAAGINPEGYTLYAYAAVQAWAQAAKGTGGVDSKAIAGWLRAGNELDTVIGKLKLDAKGDILDAKYVWYKWAKGNYAETDAP